MFYSKKIFIFIMLAFGILPSVKSMRSIDIMAPDQIDVNGDDPELCMYFSPQVNHQEAFVARLGSGSSSANYPVNQPVNQKMADYMRQLIDLLTMPNSPVCCHVQFKNFLEQIELQTSIKYVDYLVKNFPQLVFESMVKVIKCKKYSLLVVFTTYPQAMKCIDGENNTILHEATSLADDTAVY